jgi:hypothetical protein
LSTFELSRPPQIQVHPSPKTRYNPRMVYTLGLFGMHLLEIAFFAGLVGSSVVVLISFIEDGKELFGKDEN